MPQPPPDFELPVINPKSTKFGPDRPPPCKGRVKGQPNFFTKDLRAAIMQAANNVGDGQRSGLVAYLEDLARHHKKAFANLLGKALPLTIGADSPSAVAIGNIVINTISAGFTIAGENMSDSPTTIEHAPQSTEQAPEETTLQRAGVRRVV